MDPSTKQFDYRKWNAYRKTPAYWGRFNAALGSHKYILSLVRQLGWETLKGGRSYADMEKLGKWLQGDKSPVKKPLCKMTTAETSIIITALENMSIDRHKKADAADQ